MVVYGWDGVVIVVCGCVVVFAGSVRGVDVVAVVARL